MKKRNMMDRIILWVIRAIVYAALGLAVVSMSFWFLCFTMWVAR